jgi:hypothetical protein
MAQFVCAHGLDDRATALVLFGQLFEVSVEVSTDLLLGFLDEAEAPLVTGSARQGSDCD